MFSRWDLNSRVEDGNAVLKYVNLVTSQKMDCIIPEDRMGADLLSWMQDQQGHGGSVVFMDGKFLAVILPEKSDTLSTFLSGSLTPTPS